LVPRRAERRRGASAQQEQAVTVALTRVVIFGEAL
jgi:hypothetical protein